MSHTPLADAYHRRQKEKAHHSDFSVPSSPFTGKSVPAGKGGMFAGPGPVPQSRAKKGGFGEKSTALITDTRGLGRVRVDHTDS